MSDISRYCSHCGAANAAESAVCFSCQHPFAESEEAQGILLNGRYQLLTQVGSGGFGGVYRAVDRAEERRIVAVKEINLRGLSAQEIIEATDGFNREVRLLSTVRHPNLPVIRDTFTDAEHWYLVMDFIEGETLETYLKDKGAPGLSLTQVLEIGLQVCTVLDYLHTREPAIIFRDLKPSNVMRTPTGQLYLIDFGIARHFSPGKLKDTMPFGSPGYAAPEQYGRAQTTPQADIYSLGALLHHLLTGLDPAESPFRFAPLPMADSTELAELDTLIQRMVATAAEERPANIAEVRATLQRLAERLRSREYEKQFATAPAGRTWTPPAPQVGTSRRRVLTNALKLGGAVVGIGGALTVCGVVLNFTRNSHFFNSPHGSAAAVIPSPGIAKQQFVYQGHKGPITALSWSPDGTMVASGSADNTVQVWRASDGTLLYTLLGYTDAVTSVVWASDRTNVIASAGNNDGTVQVWDALRDHRELIFHGDGRVLALDWQRQSPWIVSGGTDEDIYTWNATTGAKGASYRGHKGNVNALLWLPTTSPGSNFSFTLPAETPTATATPAPFPTPAPPGPTPTAPPFPTPTPPGVTSTPTTMHTDMIASGGADSTVQVWDAKTGQRITTYRVYHGAINGLAFVSGKLYNQYDSIAVACDDGTVRSWTPLASDIPIVYARHRRRVNAVTSLASSESLYYGPLIVSASDDQTVQVWQTSRTDETLITYRDHHAPVKAVAASPVDRRIVSGDSAGKVHLWTVSGLSY